MYICEICGTKKRPKKNLCISVKSVGQNFHRISRMNQRQTCLSDYSRIFADIWPLANGSRPICAAVVFWSRRFRRFTQIFLRGIIFVPQISQIYTDFLHHRKVFHRISRMNRKAFLLIGLLTEFRGYLAAGQWLAPDMCCYCFLSRRFRR